MYFDPPSHQPVVWTFDFISDITYMQSIKVEFSVLLQLIKKNSRLKSMRQDWYGWNQPLNCVMWIFPPHPRFHERERILNEHDILPPPEQNPGYAPHSVTWKRGLTTPIFFSTSIFIWILHIEKHAKQSCIHFSRSCQWLIRCSLLINL